MCVGGGGGCSILTVHILLQLFSITYGKILVTINRATTILETDDHFFVPKGEQSVSVTFLLCCTTTACSWYLSGLMVLEWASNA